MKKINLIMNMFATNFNGFYELRHLPRSGGFYEQDAEELEEILLIKSILNKCIQEKRKKESND